MLLPLIVPQGSQQMLSWKNMKHILSDFVYINVFIKILHQMTCFGMEDEISNWAEIN